MLAFPTTQAVHYRLHVNHLASRLPPGAYVAAAHCSLQDSWPRSGLISLAARVQSCTPDAWADPRLLQTYSPRAAVHLLPAADFGVFTVGRLPADPHLRSAIEADAERLCRVLAGRASRTHDLPAGLNVRAATATGRIEIRWDARSLWLRERPRPDIDRHVAAIELARRHLHHYGPTTPDLFARWSGLSPHDARSVWHDLGTDLQEVWVDGVRSWIRTEDADLLAAAPPVTGVRFLPAEEMRLFEFTGSGRLPPPYADTFHPHALLVDGEIIGAWGRRGGRISLRVARPDQLPALDAEVAALPIPGQRATLRITDVAAS